MAKRQAELKNIEVKEVYGNTVILHATYLYFPVGAISPSTSTQEIKTNLWEKNGLRRLYLDGRDGRLGYWDIVRKIWRPHDEVRQGYLAQVIQAVAEAALEELDKEKARQEAVHRRAIEAKMK